MVGHRETGLFGKSFLFIFQKSYLFYSFSIPLHSKHVKLDDMGLLNFFFFLFGS